MAGQRIDDRSSWIGAGPAGVVYPAGAKMKKVESTEGFGELNHYEDTNEQIVKQQRMNDQKFKSHPRKDNMRN